MLIVYIYVYMWPSMRKPGLCVDNKPLSLYIASFTSPSLQAVQVL